MQTEHGFDRPATVNSPAQQPSSYAVTSQGTKYIRNRRHLPQVSEPLPDDSEEDLPLLTNAGALTTPSNEEEPMHQPQSPKVGCDTDTDNKCSLVLEGSAALTNITKTMF